MLKFAGLVVKAVLVPVVVLIGLETALRAADYGYASDFSVPCSLAGKAAFCNNDRYTWQFFPKGAVRIAPAFAFPAVKPADTFRIFVVGESAAQGDPEPSFGFARYLEMMLRQRFPETRFEVINTGLTALNSHALLPAVRDLARHDPDLFLIYMGNNEVVGPFGAEHSGAFGGLALTRFGIFLRSTRLWQLVENLTDAAFGESGPGEWRGMETFLDQQVPADSDSLISIQENFRENLRDIVSAATGGGARVLLSTVAVNLKDSPPFASLHRPGLSDTETKTWEASFNEGIALERTGNCADALTKYRSAAAIDDRYAELRYRMGRCLAKQEQFDAAAKQFEAARDLDALHFRIDGKTNEIIRSVAREAGSGVELLDAAELLDTADRSHAPGSEFFYDHVHFNPHGNYLVASALFARVLDALPDRLRHSAGSHDPLDEQQSNELLALTPYDRARILRGLLAEFNQQPFLSQIDHEQKVEEIEREAASEQEPPAQTANAYRLAITKTADDHWLHYNYARFLDPYEPAAAAFEYRKALELLPTDIAIRDKLAAALVRGEEFEDGIAEAREVLKRMPYDVPAYLTIAYGLARLEQYDESIAAYRQAMSLRPEMSVDAYNEIGILQTRQGRYDAAAETFRKAIELDTGRTKVAELQKNLSYTLQQLSPAVKR